MNEDVGYDPTLAPNLLDEDDAVTPPAVKDTALGTEQSLVPMPLNPSVRKQMRSIESHIQRANEGVDLYMEKKPEVAIRFQKNMIELRKLQLEFLKFNSELYSRGTGVDAASAARSTEPDNTDRPSVNLSANDAMGVEILGQILAAGKSSGGVPSLVECSAVPSPTKPEPGDDC